MRISSQSNNCSIHNEQLVGVDLNPQNDENYTHCCVKCVQNKNSKNHILIYSEAQQYIQEQKKAFLFDKETQFQTNKVLLNKLIKSLHATKNEYNQLFDQLVEFINQQLVQSEQVLNQQYNKLENLDLDSYLSTQNEFFQPENEYKVLKLVTEKKLEEIQSKNQLTQSQDFYCEKFVKRILD